MGKNKPFKPPASFKKPESNDGGTSSSSKSNIPLIGLALSGTVLLMAIGVYVGMEVGQGHSVRDAFANVKETAKNPGKAFSELTERERLQQGRAPTNKRARCEDRGSCGAVTKEECEADPKLAKRCCRSCHTLTCIDYDEQCEDWAFADQCLDNPEYMKKNCCFSCAPDPDDPCSMDPSSRPDVYKGDIDKTFERIIKEYPQYNPTAHSKDPWVLTFDNLLDDEECAGIIEAVGGKHGEYIKPSTTAKPVRQANGQVVLTDVPDQIRTSHNAWCQHRGCYDHPIHERVIQRIMKIVDLNPNNAEHMQVSQQHQTTTATLISRAFLLSPTLPSLSSAYTQLLRYGQNEYYRLHHDWIPEQLDAACGPRAFTFFLYLSDVEEGGGTQFPYINITVMPKKGSAVLWPHGLNSDPRIKDTRTHHEAMPVIKGQKWGANYWIHGRDFKTSMATGCDGRQGQPKRSRMMKQGAAEKRLKEDAQQRIRK